MTRSFSDLYRTLHRFLVRLFGGRAPRIGLEISDQAVRILYERKGTWELEQVQLTPGTLDRGRVLNAPLLLQALAELRKRAAGGDARRVGVHVSLTSAPVYAQLVTIPPVSDAELPAAVELNVQVSAPVALTELAWGWQVLPNQNPPAVLAAWTSRELADGLVSLLAEASFLPASLEPKVLSVARLVREVFPNGSTGAYLLATLDEIGITLAILEAGVVRFQYARTWEEIRGTAPDITYQTIETLMRREVPQVAGFYQQRGGEHLVEVLLATPTFADEISKTLTDLGFMVRPLTIGSPPFPLHGYAAFGAALRGNVFSTSDQADLSLLGGQVLEWLRKELVARIASFWTLVAPLALGLLLITYTGAYFFIREIHRTVAAKTPQEVGASLLVDLTDGEAKAKQFNDLVAAMAKIQGELRPKSPQLVSLLAMANQSGVVLTHISLNQDGTGRSSVSGVAGSENQLLSLKRAFEANPSLSSVSLPVTGIITGPDGVSFAMSFVSNFSAVAKPVP